MGGWLGADASCWALRHLIAKEAKNIKPIHHKNLQGPTREIVRVLGTGGPVSSFFSSPPREGGGWLCVGRNPGGGGYLCQAQVWVLAQILAGFVCMRVLQ